MNFFIEQNVLLKGGGWQYANSGKEVFRQAAQSKCSKIELQGVLAIRGFWGK